MSPVTPTPPEAAAMRAGADLRAARERLGWSLQDVEESLRIRMAHLEALEEGRLSLLPGNAYALAFVRTYAGALGLDAEAMVRRFKAEAAAFNRRTELVFPVPMPDRGLPGGAVFLVGLVLAILSYAGWYRLSGEGRVPAETVTEIPQRLASLAEQAIPPATVTPRVAVAEAVVDVAQPVATSPSVAISPSSAAAAPAPVQPVDQTRIMLRATADAWVQVKDRGGVTLLNRILKAGETWSAPPVRGDLLMTTGNAGGTELVVDGVTAPSLGNTGMVRRDIPLDPDLLKDGKFAGAFLPQVVYSRGRQ